MTFKFASNPLPSLSPPALPPSPACSGLRMLTTLSLALDDSLLIFSQAFTPVFLNLTLLLHHRNSQLVTSLIKPPSVVSYCHQQFLSKGWGSFEHLEGARNSSLCWTIHSYCRILRILGRRLLTASRNPQSLRQPRNAHTHSQNCPIVTRFDNHLYEKSVFLNMVCQGLLPPLRLLTCYTALTHGSLLTGTVVTSPPTSSPS